MQNENHIIESVGKTTAQLFKLVNSLAVRKQEISKNITEYFSENLDADPYLAELVKNYLETDATFMIAVTEIFRGYDTILKYDRKIIDRYIDILKDLHKPPLRRRLLPKP